MTKAPNDAATDPQQTVADLQSRLGESLARETATAEVMRLINASPGDLAPVFEAIVEKAMRFCDAGFGGLWLVEGDLARAAATRNVPDAYMEFLTRRPVPQGEAFGPNMKDRPAVHIADLAATELYRRRSPVTVASVELGGIRTYLAVPLRDGNTLAGVLSLCRKEVRPFTDRQIALVQTFADQAVIAIKNARLFNETKEALERQTATADILKVIASSPSNVQPVFEAIVNSAAKLFQPCGATITMLDDGKLHWRATASLLPDFEIEHSTAAVYPVPFEPNRSPSARAILERRIIEIPDLAAPDTPEITRKAGAAAGFRSATFVPLVNQGQGIGSIVLIHPQAGFKLSEKQLALVQTFADQAVIAIENVRLFNEVQAQTRHLSEALERQTATADVLKAISRSAFNLDSVLETLISTATRLCNCGPKGGQIFRREGDVYRYAASQMNVDPDYLRHEQTTEIKPGRGTLIGRVALSKRTVMIADAWSDPEYEEKDAAQTGNVRAMLGVPLLRDGEPIGAFALARSEPIAFTEREVELVISFADQAVIAIENVRLFDEVQAKTRDLEESLQFQIAASDVLKVISSLPDKLQPVLDAIVETSRDLCDSDGASIFLLRDGKFHFTAVAGAVPKHLEYLRASPAPNDGPVSVFTRAFELKRTVHYPNVAEDPDLNQGHDVLGGPRALLVAPLMRDGEVLGVIIVRQSHLKPFSLRQIQAIEIFADQAVVAISNVNLFNEVQQRTRELTKSLDDLRTAQDRLVQTEKLASLGQLTAGIAHEIKNPLNFVNNFSALSAELIEEMKDMLSGVSLDKNKREDLDEITQMLKSNLDKVVQHGKRADSIVKNMLLHSRQGSGEHRPVDINAIVDESLNLAYHGARAENNGFNITMHRSFDPAVGMADGYPQEITRALLNLISNGFYAATKRKADTGDGFEPTLTATTRNLGDKVEIRIRDNGTGIPAEVKEKIFNPFFTTKPAGEGTGLGLSMSHDIIVKQHGGTMDVDTMLGVFTEFKIVLPRAGASLVKPGERP